MSDTIKNPDRLSISISGKASKDYNSRGCGLTYSTDCNEGETKEEAADRASEFIRKWMRREIARDRKK